MVCLTLLDSQRLVSRESHQKLSSFCLRPFLGDPVPSFWFSSGTRYLLSGVPLVPGAVFVVVVLSVVDLAALRAVQLEDLPGFVAHDLSHNLDATILEGLVRFGKHRPLLEVENRCVFAGGSVDNSLHSAPESGAEAHCAWFARGVELVCGKSRRFQCVIPDALLSHHERH